MPISERARHDMIVALRDRLGTEPAMTLIDHLPPGGWAEVATRHDLAQLELRMDLRFEAVDRRFEAVDHRFETIDHRFDIVDQRFDTLEARVLGHVDQRLAAQTRSMMVAFVTAMVAFGGLLVAAISLGH